MGPGIPGISPCEVAVLGLTRDGEADTQLVTFNESGNRERDGRHS